MHTHHPSLPLLMILMALPSLVLPVGNSANGDVVQDKTMPSETQDHQTLTLFVPEQLRIIFVERVRSDIMPHLRDMAKRLVIQDKERGLKHIQDLGFHELKDEKDIDGIDIGNPIRIYEVRLDELRAVVPRTNVKSLLRDTGQLLFPMKVKEKEEVQSSMTLRFVCDRPADAKQMEEKECWRPTRVGHPNLIRLVTEKQSKLEQDLKDKEFLVSIPALNRNFLGYEDKKAAIWLIPLVKDHHFTKEEPDQAENVFKWLSKEAHNMDESPR